ncbi:hypothetical protein KFL_000270340 [Klebsormidium nitens]|uniref:Rab-like protein 5 n=1 Tax=Klebsormidium nitens TaxID=105231 RepID=A0A1Y1HKZ1_KLENI|nr:hypothetical protein KFL_000270340 [Klebsormidium nitens]|eukprot:GAQ79275.1 hypothetical protein KFL_000270340 [Klebsormidium nitens]
MESATKICVVGPPGVGKTAIARLLADWDTSAGAPYVATQALRIQELDRSLGKKRFSIQLWDCSGDSEFQPCWPALQRGAHGLILVRNAEASLEEQEKQLENWYKVFATPNRLKASQCVIVNVSRSNGGVSGLPAGSGRGLLANVNQVNVSLLEPDCQQRLFLALEGILGGA